MAFALTETQLATPLPRVRWPRQRLATLKRRPGILPHLRAAIEWRGDIADPGDGWVGRDPPVAGDGPNGGLSGVGGVGWGSVAALGSRRRSHYSCEQTLISLAWCDLACGPGVHMVKAGTGAARAKQGGAAV
jgi:hypothetical protein